MKYHYYVLLILLSLLFTNCFEVIEEVIINDDGSGHITMTVNMSQSKTKVKSIMLMDSINNHKIPTQDEIEKNMNKMIAEIKSIPGVHNVKNRMDFEEFIFSVSCDFDDLDILNSVISHFSTDNYKEELAYNKQFEYDATSKIFSRNYHYNLAREIEKVKQRDREVLHDATVTTIHKFESTVASSSNKDSKIAGNKKAVMLRVGVTDMINDKKNIKNSIILQ